MNAFGGRTVMESGFICLKRNVLRFMRRKNVISSRSSINFDTNKIEPEGSWPSSDEERRELNAFGPPKGNPNGNVTEPFCAR